MIDFLEESRGHKDESVRLDYHVDLPCELVLEI